MSVDYQDRIKWYNSIIKRKSGEYTYRQFRESGIKYIFLDGIDKQNFIHGEAMWQVTGARKVFENDEVIIYRE
jgi:hypothetical protein